MKKLIAIVPAIALVTVLAQPSSEIQPPTKLYFPVICPPDASPDFVTGISVYVHCPGCPNMQQIYTNAPIQVFAPGTNYFLLDDKLPPGTQLWATMVGPGGESQLSNMVTNFFVGPPTALQPIRK